MSRAHYPGRLKGLVLQAGPNGLLEFLAGLELDTVWPNRSVRFQTKFWSTEFGPLYLVHKFFAG